MFKFQLPGISKKKPAEKKKPQHAPAKEPPEPGDENVEFLPTRISDFDALVDKGGVERGNTLLVAGGCGTGKSTFVMQSIYNGVKAGEKGAYLSFEEPIEKLRRHMKINFGWDLRKYEKLGRLAMLKLDPFKIARSVEASVIEKSGELMVEVESLELPFVPDRVAVDSLSALGIAFMGNIENYRYYIRHLFEMLDKYRSVNFVISETELDPGIYSRSGIEEFLADGVIVLYNLKSDSKRLRALEILKMRCSNHVKGMMPFSITKKGVVISKDKSILHYALQRTPIRRSSFTPSGFI